MNVQFAFREGLDESYELSRFDVFHSEVLQYAGCGSPPYCGISLFAITPPPSAIPAPLMQDQAFEQVEFAQQSLFAEKLIFQCAGHSNSRGWGGRLV
jgi:hypothetical protein